MKIFNWVHRKFHPNVDYRMVSIKKDVVAAERAERKEKLMHERDTQALLNNDDQVILAGALDGLHDRILSIGTFGLGHVDEYSVYCEEENGNKNEKEEDDDGDDDDNDYNNDNDINDHDIEEKNETMLSMPSQVEEDTRNSLALSEIIESSEIIEEEDEEKTPEEKTKKKGERTTLADLFWEEKTAAAAVGSAINGKKFESLETSPPGNIKKAVYQKKQVKSLAKKLIMPWKGEESRPKAKVQRLISRMLKRKIHPEVEFKSTDDGGLIGGPNYISCNNNLEANESLPLLQDGVVRS